MAIYTCICNTCGTQKDMHAKIADRDNIISDCCNSVMTRKLIAPQVSAGIWTGHKGYVSTDKKWIESAQDHKAYMKQRNLIPFEEGKQEVEKVQRDTQAAHEKKIDKVVAEAIAAHT